MNINWNYLKRDQETMDKLVSDARKDERTEGYTVPIFHLIIDLRSVRLQKKIK